MRDIGVKHSMNPLGMSLQVKKTGKLDVARLKNPPSIEIITIRFPPQVCNGSMGLI